MSEEPEPDPPQDPLRQAEDVILGAAADDDNDDEDDGAATTAAPTVSVTTAAATVASPRHADQQQQQHQPLWPQWGEMFSLLAGLLMRQFGSYYLKPTRDDEATGLPLVVLDAETDFEVVYSSSSLGRSTGWTKATLLGRQGLSWLQLTSAEVHSAVNAEACESLSRQQQQLKAHLRSGQAKPNPAAELMVTLTPSGLPTWTMLLSVPAPLPSTGSMRSRYLVVAVMTLGARVPYHVFCGLRPRLAVAKGLMDVAREDLLAALADAGLGDTAVGTEDVANFDLEAEIQADSEGRGFQGTLMRAIEGLRRNIIHLHEDACEAPHYMPKLGWSCVETFDVLHGAHKTVSQVHRDQLLNWRIPREDQNYHQLKQKAEQHGGCCCWLDPTGVENPIVYLSPGFEQLTGYQRVWALGRSVRFLQPRRWLLNGSEDTRFQEFVEDPAKSGHLLTLFLHERSDGKHFWNVILAERYHFADSLGRRDPGIKYIGLSMLNLVVEREVLDMVVQEEIAGRGSGERQLEIFRSMLRERDETYQDRSKRGIQTLLRQVSQEWFLTVSHGMGVGRLLRWAPGSHFIEDFSSNWPKLMEQAVPFVRQALGLKSFDGSQTAEDCPFLACVSNSALVDSPVVFMTKAFRETFEYRDSHQVLGSNWRFFQPMNRELPLTEAFQDLQGLLEGRSVARPASAKVATEANASANEEGEGSRCLVLLQRRLGERIWTLSCAKPFLIDDCKFVLRVFVPLPKVLMPDWMVSHSTEEAQQACDCSARLMKPLKVFVESQQKADGRSLHEVSAEITQCLNELLRPYLSEQVGKDSTDKQTDNDNDECQTVVPENEEVELTINGRSPSKSSHHRPSEASIAPLTAVATCCSSPTASRTGDAEADHSRPSSPSTLPPLRRVRRAQTGGVSTLPLIAGDPLGGGGSSSSSSRPRNNNNNNNSNNNSSSLPIGSTMGAAAFSASGVSDKFSALPPALAPTSPMSGVRELQRRMRRANTDRFATVEEEVLRPLSLPPLALNSPAKDSVASPAPSSSASSPPGGGPSSPLAAAAMTTLPTPPADPRPNGRFQRFNRGNSSGAAVLSDGGESPPMQGFEDEAAVPNADVESCPLVKEKEDGKEEALLDVTQDECLSADRRLEAPAAVLDKDSPKADSLGAAEEAEEDEKHKVLTAVKGPDAAHAEAAEQQEKQEQQEQPLCDQLLQKHGATDAVHARDSELTVVPSSISSFDAPLFSALVGEDPTVEAATRIAAMALPQGDVAIAHAVQGLKDRGWPTDQICELFKLEASVIESMLAEREQQE